MKTLVRIVKTIDGQERWYRDENGCLFQEFQKTKTDDKKPKRGIPLANMRDLDRVMGW